MVLLGLFVLSLAALWWIWLRTDPERPSARTTAPPSPPGAAVPPGEHRHRGPVRRYHAVGPALSEDDVIAFGLALESTDDVVRCATTDGSPAPAERRAGRDAPGAS